MAPEPRATENARLASCWRQSKSGRIGIAPGSNSGVIISTLSGRGGAAATAGLFSHETAFLTYEGDGGGERVEVDADVRGGLGLVVDLDEHSVGIGEEGEGAAFGPGKSLEEVMWGTSILVPSIRMTFRKSGPNRRS